MTPEERADAICRRYWDDTRGEFWCHRSAMREMIEKAVEAAEAESRETVAEMIDRYLVIRTQIPMAEIVAMVEEIRHPAKPTQESVA